MKTSAKKICVVVPTRNRLELLKETLNSLLLQSFKDFELIVSVNNSEDETEGFLKERKINYISHSHTIPMLDHWNYLMQLGDSEYIAILHDDDIYPPNFLDEMCRSLDENPDAIFAHCPAVHFYKKESDGRLVDPHYPPIMRTSELLETFASEMPKILCSAIVYRRKFVSSFKYSDKYISFDQHYWMQILKQQGAVVFNRSTWVFYRKHANTFKKFSPFKVFSEYREMILSEIDSQDEKARIEKEKRLNKLLLNLTLKECFKRKDIFRLGQYKLLYEKLKVVGCRFDIVVFSKFILGNIQ